MPSPSSVPPASLGIEDHVRRLIDRHPDQVKLYASGKGCVGFFFGKMVKRFADADPKTVYDAVVRELERRVKPS